MSEIVKRLNNTLGSVETSLMKGDNLAIVLCSAFDDHGPEVDEYGWSQAAIDGHNATIKAIQDHYAPLETEITRLEAEVSRLALEKQGAQKEWLEIAAKVAGQACWKHSGDDTYSKGMDAGAIHQTRACVEAIRALIPQEQGEKGK